MAERKNGFLLYKDLLPQFEMLTDEQAGQLIKAILTYVNDMEVPPLEPEVRIAFGFIKAILKRDLQKYEGIIERNIENGKKGGRPTKEQNPENPVGYLGNPTKPKKADSDSGSVIESDSHSDRDIKTLKKTLGQVMNEMVVDYTTNFDLRKALQEFIEFRKSTKPALTELAFTKSLNTLTRLYATDDAKKIEAIDQSIENGWKGIFDIRGKGKQEDKLTYKWQGELKAEQDEYDNRTYEPKRTAKEVKDILDKL